ncbi:MAG: hypothetical protein WCL71_00995 [Deltaproteobacteria bacterium]
MTELRPLGSTGITPLPYYYGPLRLPTVHTKRVIDSPPVFSLRRIPFALGITSDIPGSSADLSTRALPNHPGQSHRFFRSFIPGEWQASSTLEDWLLPFKFNEAETGSLKRKVADIKKRDIVLLLESIIERGSPASANNNFKIIRKMFRFAVQRDIIEHSPCDGVVMPAPLNRGDRVLSEIEMKTLWNNLDSCHVSDDIRSAIRLILLTGQRPGEVIGMHTDEISERWWTIPAERSKNKKAHRV